MALNVLHYAGVEGDLDPSLPIWGSGGYAKFVPLMCKPAIKRVPAPWGAASHGIGVRFKVDPELFMIHLKFHDRKELRARSERRKLMFDADGRGVVSNWQIGGQAMTRELRNFVREEDPEDVPEFDPQQIDLGSIVHHYKIGLYRTTPHVGQMKTMKRNRSCAFLSACLVCSRGWLGHPILR